MKIKHLIVCCLVAATGWLLWKNAPVMSPGTRDEPSKRSPRAIRVAPPGTAAGLAPAEASETLVASMLREGIGGQRGPALARFRDLSSGELAAILAEIEQLAASPKRLVLLADFHQGWAERDPVAALESALRFGPDATRGVLAGWSSNAPAAAWDWVGRAETTAGSSTGDITSFYRTILTTLAKQDREDTAAGLMDTLPVSTLRMTLAGQLAETWAAKSPGELATWLQRNETVDKDATGFAANQLGIGLARRGPAAVLEALAAQSEFVGNALVGAAVAEWTRTDRSEDTDTLIRSLAGISIERSDAILAQLGYATAQKDPASALALMLKIQTPELRNRWLSTGASMLMQSAPAEAMDFAAAISDEAARTARAKRVYSQWVAKDATAARAKLDSGRFPPDLREALLAEGK